MSNEASGNGLDLTLREFAAGQKLFNRYTLIKTLGRGGMGVVWLGRDDELERDVALKFLPELVIRDRAVLGDLKRETRRSLDLTHKNIVRIYDFVQSTESACISMEYVDGDTLSNLRADKPHKIFEPDELREWVSQLCDALDYAHNHARIVHRDLKPANLMVNQRGDLKVADFGIARSLSDSVSKLTMEHGKSGTLVYMSPQQLDGDRGNHLDDVYSLGASVYELLTSKPPFYSGNIDRQIREKMPPPMKQRRDELEIEGDPIDATWEEVVRACLAKEPARRPQSIAEIAKRLEVPSPKTRRAARDAKQSNKRVALFAAVGALIIAAAIGGWYFGFFQNFGKTRSVAITQPPVTEPKISTPIETQSAIQPFIQAFVQDMASNDSTLQMRYYNNPCRYYDQANTLLPAVRKDIERDITAWKKRIYSLHTQPVIRKTETSEYTVTFEMAYTLEDGKPRSSGILAMSLTLKPVNATFLITGIQKTVILGRKQ